MGTFNMWIFGPHVWGIFSVGLWQDEVACFLFKYLNDRHGDRILSNGKYS
jgi:hypothetical protein